MNNKVILITGANGLIGREVADALASAGANLAKKTLQLIATQGRKFGIGSLSGISRRVKVPL